MLFPKGEKGGHVIVNPGIEVLGFVLLFRVEDSNSRQQCVLGIRAGEGNWNGSSDPWRARYLPLKCLPARTISLDKIIIVKQTWIQC